MAASGPARELVLRLGPHPATTLGIDLEAGGDDALARWLVASFLLGGRTPEECALRAFRRLEKDGLVQAAVIARAGAVAVHACLEEAGFPRSEATASLLVRVCRALAERHAGSLERALRGSDDLEDLAGRLASLASSFGRASVLRFLTPLRERWSAAADLPASPAVFAAARDLGLVPAWQDESGTPAGLRRWLEAGTAHDTPERAPAPAPRDLEAALDRLGRAACLRGAVDRCPLAERCPKRDEPSRRSEPRGDAR